MIGRPERAFGSSIIILTIPNYRDGGSRLLLRGLTLPDA